MPGHGFRPKLHGIHNPGGEELTDELTEELKSLETRFWTDGADFYRGHLAKGCRMVFPQMGALSREQAIQGIEEGPRWESVHMTDVHTETPSSEMAVLTYQAEASRTGQPAYRAYVGSVYVRQAGAWALAFHQHTRG